VREDAERDRRAQLDAARSDTAQRTAEARAVDASTVAAATTVAQVSGPIQRSRSLTASPSVDRRRVRPAGDPPHRDPRRGEIPITGRRATRVARDGVEVRRRRQPADRGSKRFTGGRAAPILA
jgi:hypothetical protein